MKKLILILTMSFMTLLAATQKTFAYIPDGTWYYGKIDLINYQLSDDGFYYTNDVVFRYTSFESLYFPTDYEIHSYDLLNTYNDAKSYQMDYQIFQYINKWVFHNDFELLLVRAGQVIHEIGQANRIMFDLESEMVRFIDANDNTIYYITQSTLSSTIDLYTLKTKRYLFTHDEMYDNGYDVGLDEGYDNGYDNGYDDGYDVGLDEGYDNGYDDGWNNQNDFWPALWGAVAAPFALFETEIFPGVTFGMIAMIPIVFGLLGFILNIGGKKQ